MVDADRRAPLVLSRIKTTSSRSHRSLSLPPWKDGVPSDAGPYLPRLWRHTALRSKTGPLHRRRPRVQLWVKGPTVRSPLRSRAPEARVTDRFGPSARLKSTDGFDATHYPPPGGQGLGRGAAGAELRKAGLGLDEGATNSSSGMGSSCPLRLRPGADTQTAFVTSSSPTTARYGHAHQARVADLGAQLVGRASRRGRANLSLPAALRATSSAVRVLLLAHRQHRHLIGREPRWGTPRCTCSM